MLTPLSWELPYSSGRAPVLARNVVATSQPLAVQAGVDALRRGGNAVDAALTAAIALTVVEPTGNGIGSDAFAIVHHGDTLFGFNGSGRSPRSWHPERFAGREGMPAYGWDSVTVPGAVDAWAQLSKRFGRLPFAELFGPAIGYAEEGFAVSPIVAQLWEQAGGIHGGSLEFAAAFLPEGRAPRAGERYCNRDQAATLRAIAESGGEAFYRGDLAGRIAGHARTSGAALSLEDLAGHRGEWVTPLAQSFAGVKLHEIPPNGQGLAALIALGILDRLDLRRYSPDSAESIHLQIEAMKAGFAEAHRHVADPECMRRGPQEFLDSSFLDSCAARIDPRRALFPVSSLPTDEGTVYLAAADERGMMVSYIQSNFRGFGSGVVVPGTGISLQNRGSGFNLIPGHPNCVGGSKRPFHTIIPGFVTRAREPLMSFGVMGGHMQPQGHVQMMVRIFLHRQNPQAACDAPRWYLSEDFQLALESGFPPGVAAALENKGHGRFVHHDNHLFGGAQFALRVGEGYCAASDHRKDGQAAGF